LLEAHGSRLVFRVHCSKGTYVRTLVEDIARAAGTVAHTANLHRESVGDFRADDMLDLAQAEEVAAGGAAALRERLLPADLALAAWPARHLEAALARRFAEGQAVAVEQDADAGLVRVYEEGEGFLGVGEITPSGRLAPRRIFNAGKP
jgi:tRNA pseudouridine55 synthase